MKHFVLGIALLALISGGAMAQTGDLVGVHAQYKNVKLGTFTAEQGEQGELEVLASTAGVSRRFFDSLTRNQQVSVRRMIELLRAGDQKNALRVWNEFLDSLQHATNHVDLNALIAFMVTKGSIEGGPAYQNTIFYSTQVSNLSTQLAGAEQYLTQLNELANSVGSGKQMVGPQGSFTIGKGTEFSDEITLTKKQIASLKKKKAAILNKLKASSLGSNVAKRTYNLTKVFTMAAQNKLTAPAGSSGHTPQKKG